MASATSSHPTEPIVLSRIVNLNPTQRTATRGNTTASAMIPLASLDAGAVSRLCTHPRVYGGADMDSVDNGEIHSISKTKDAVQG